MVPERDKRGGGEKAASGGKRPGGVGGRLKGKKQPPHGEKEGSSEGLKGREREEC